MQAPKGGDEADYYFVSDSYIASRERRKRRENFTEGAALRIRAKVLDLLVDGTQLYVATAGFEIVRIDLPSRAVRGPAFRGHAGPVTSLALLGSDLIVSGSWDKTTAIWDKATGTRQHVLEGHTDFVKTVATFPGGILTGSSDTTIRAWSVTGEPLAVLKAHRRPVEHLLVSHGVFYSASSDGVIYEWDLSNLSESAAPLRMFAGHLTTVYELALDDESDSLVAVSADKTARVFSRSTGEQEACFEHPDWVRCVVVNAGKVFTGCKDELIRCWSLSTGVAERTIDGHFDEVTCLALYEGTLISGSIDSTVRFWPVSAAAMEAAEAAAKAAARKPAIVLSAEEEAELEALMQDDE